ncbi:hypothetical protein [Streptomyces microflavus]|uniref:hypothetical protein n=1 Tax=Streptomyces microflavus TaxID=1919 RepID=UPI0033BD4F62
MNDRRPLGTRPHRADHTELPGARPTRAGLAAERLPAVQTAAEPPAGRPDGRRTLGTGPTAAP